MEEDQSKSCNLIAVYWTQKTYFYYDIVPFNIILIVLTNTDCCQLTVPKWFLFSQRLWIRDWTPNCWPNSCSSCNKFYGKPGSQQCCRLNRFFFQCKELRMDQKSACNINIIIITLFDPIVQFNIGFIRHRRSLATNFVLQSKQKILHVKNYSLYTRTA